MKSSKLLIALLFASLCFVPGKSVPQKPKTNTEARKLVSIAYVNVYYGEAYQYNGMWQVKGEEFATTPSNETIVAIWSRDSAITH